MSKFHRYFSYIVIVMLMSTATAYAQLATPVTPPTTHDGSCRINFVEINNFESWGASYAMMDYLCSGSFRGGVETELHVSYDPVDFSKVAPAGLGYVSGSYQAPNIPGYDALYTSAPMFPGFVSRAVATIRWETDEFRCMGWYCGHVWESQTVSTDSYVFP